MATARPALLERIQRAIDDRSGFELDLAASIGVALHDPRIIVDQRERSLAS